MKQSSVEWLALKIIGMGFTISGSEFDQIREYVDIATIMHRQEHENAFFEGAKCFREGQAWTNEGFREFSHIVYNETFGKSEQ